MGNQTPCHSSFSGEIICGPHRGSFEVRDPLRSNLRIISGLGIICSRGSFAALYSTEGIKAFSKRIRRCSVDGRKRYENDKCGRKSF